MAGLYRALSGQDERFIQSRLMSNLSTELSSFYRVYKKEK
jgi:hypothetical protein